MNGKEITALTTGSFQATVTGLEVHGAPKMEEWVEFGRGLRRIDGSLKWVIGDWLNYGELQYGDKFSLASKIWPEYEYETLHKLKYVAAKVMFGTRVPNLSFRHHMMVAPLRQDDQERWLAKAAEKQWGCRELETAIKVKRLGVPVVAFTLLDEMTDALKQVSRIMHLMGSPRTPVERKRNIAYVKQAISVLRSTLNAAERLLTSLEASR